MSSYYRAPAAFTNTSSSHSHSHSQPSHTASSSAAAHSTAQTSGSFVDRISYYPLSVEEMPYGSHTIERQYLLGGGKAKRKGPGVAGGVEYGGINTDIDQPLPPHIAERTLAWGNLLQLLLAGGLVAVCWYESTDSRNADEHCPLLYIGVFIGSLVALISLFGVIGFAKAFAGDLFVPSRKTVLYIYLTGVLLAMILLILFAVSTLLHWDAGGQVAFSLFNQAGTVGVRHRYLIWGMALATGLATVVSLFGLLGLRWSDDDAVFRWTLFTTCFFVSLFGASLVAITVCIVVYGEYELLPHPAWIIISAIGGAFLVFTGIWGMIIRDQPGEHNNINLMTSRLTKFIIFLSVGAGVVLIASIGNAITAETDQSSDRRTLALLAGLLGIWTQLNSIVAITAAARWRYVYGEENRRGAKSLPDEDV